MARQTWVLSYFPFAISLNTVHYFRHLLTLINNTVLGLGSYTLTDCISVPLLLSQQMKRAWCCSASAIAVLEEPLETIWHLVCAVWCVHVHVHLILMSFNCTFRHYFSGNGKVNCLLAQVLLMLYLVIRQIASHHLLTTSENLVANAQFLLALVASESQFRALC